MPKRDCTGPDAAAQENRFAIEIPKLASLILKHEADGELKGIDAFPGEHPPVLPVFLAFRAMVGVGMLMLAAVMAVPGLATWLPQWLLAK